MNNILICFKTFTLTGAHGLKLKLHILKLCSQHLLNNGDKKLTIYTTKLAALSKLSLVANKLKLQKTFMLRNYMIAEDLFVTFVFWHT